MVESSNSALSRTISYVSWDIILAGRPFFGFTIGRSAQGRDGKFIEIYEP